MKTLNLKALSESLGYFWFQRAFVQELGWTAPVRPRSLRFKAAVLQPIAQLVDLMVFEASPTADELPSLSQRVAIHWRVATRNPSHLIIYVDKVRRRSLFSSYRDWGTSRPAFHNAHFFARGQGGPLMRQLAALLVMLGEKGDQGYTAVSTMTSRLQEIMSRKAVTRQFLRACSQAHLLLTNSLNGAATQDAARLAANLLLRLLVMRFLTSNGPPVLNLVPRLQMLDSSGMPPLPDPFPFADDAPGKALACFAPFTFRLNVEPTGAANEVDLTVLQSYLERVINERDLAGAITAPEVLTSLAEETLSRCVAERYARDSGIPRADSLGDLLWALDHAQCKRMMEEILPRITVIDPSCGSGSLLLSAYDTLLEIYESVACGLDPDAFDYMLIGERELERRLAEQIVARHLFGVDTDPWAIVISRLQLTLRLRAVASEATITSPPALDLHLRVGDAIGTSNGGGGPVGPPWDSDLAQVLQSGGFAVVLNHPPWSSVRHKDKHIAKQIDLPERFVRRSMELLRNDGYGALVLPASLFQNDRTMALRAALLSQTHVEVLLVLTNLGFLLTGVHQSFRFCLLLYKKGDSTRVLQMAFPHAGAADPQPLNLASVLHDPGAQISLPVELLYRMSPKALRIPELLDQSEVEIVAQLARFSRLTEEFPTLRWYYETHRLDTADRIQIASEPGLLPVYEGAMIQQFEAQVRPARRRGPAPEGKDSGYYRIAVRATARATDSRTLFATVLPSASIATDSLLIGSGLHGRTLCYLVALLNSFVLDFFLRRTLWDSSRITMALFQDLPIVPFAESDPLCCAITQRSARLLCQGPEFAQLARDSGLDSFSAGAIAPVRRAKLKAELDGIIAHSYQIEEEAFVHLLSTFPGIPSATLVAAHNAWRDADQGRLQ